MRKVIEWLKASNRWKHLVGGAVVGAVMVNCIDSVMASALVGAAMEYKDKAWGGKFDWVDCSLTAVGGVVVAVIKWCLMGG